MTRQQKLGQGPDPQGQGQGPEPQGPGQDKNLKYVLKESLRTRTMTSINITGESTNWVNLSKNIVLRNKC